MVSRDFLEQSIVSLQSKQKKMMVAGIVLTVCGGFMAFVGFILVMVGATQILAGIPLGTLLNAIGAIFLSLNSLVTSGGIALLILRSTLLVHKINNRKYRIALMDEEAGNVSQPVQEEVATPVAE